MPIRSLTLLFLIAFALSASPAGFSHAQTAQDPQIILTWSAQNFFPADFQGKASVTLGSPVLVSAAATQNGKLIDLSSATFLWYVDNQLVSKGTGLMTMRFSASTKTEGDSYLVRVSVSLGTKGIDSTIGIPVGTPEIVLPPYGREASALAGSHLSFSAVPYFFNVPSLDQLKFLWSVNSVIQDTEGTSRFAIDIGSGAAGQSLWLKAVAQNKTYLPEYASAQTQINIQ